MSLSAQDFLTDFHHTATIGATANGGVDRQAGTAKDGEIRSWFRDWGTERGYPVRVDSIGNMFMLAEWTPGVPFVLVGSHLDSQPLAGRFDGAYGVVAAMHVLREIDAEVQASGEKPSYNLGVVNWFNEEGARFAPSIMGSSVFVGLMNEQDTLSVSDSSGTRVGEALEGIGFLGTDPRPEVATYAEIHIEQGRILEREGIPLGTVDRSWYTQKLDIEVLGEQSHTGATSMADRRDALVAASKIVVMVNEVTEDFEEDTLLSSVGQMHIEPNSPIVVPRRVHLVADLRSDSQEIVQAARATLLEKFDVLAADHRVEVNVEDFDVRPPRHFQESGLELVEKLMADKGLDTRRIRTRAGHDAVALSTQVPSVLLFVPSVDGVSHCEREFTEDEDLVTGLDALTEVARALVDGALQD
ncbi:M20 family metallo-hydrolase [Kocuria sp. NPDC057446]|uniref:M20 family metallo-hydrolase n=1 Tax=Kocuria sp. NPDC057446 TaxID=3346137 RepID=UPI0036AFCF87